MLQAHLTPAIANVENEVNLGSSQAGFTAVFKANNTPLFGIYDENTTSAVLTGVCKPGDLIVILGAGEVVKNPSLFCPENGVWSTSIDLTIYPGYSSSDSTQPISASTRGSSNSSVNIHLTYSPTAIPAAGAGSYIYFSNGKTYLSSIAGGGTQTGSFSQRISHIGLTQKMQYQYRMEIYRAGSLHLTLGTSTSLTSPLEITAPYTWQNGDTVKVTPFDSSGDKSSINVAIPDPAGVSI
ncbi:hypothetical protein Bdt_2305 [Bdellovibrio bacteriovorus str. Tiberius]|uniref:Uncharacterized protein n=1 Tax=Bdellovibrio bacteriovorus str. Tiberius TaxID=1069642 RepID=K7YWE0_BDEBC|nr:hypothetical protein Bdt_2305 [Bdellovibrio bacteriovorus str. Tiberius]